MQHIKAFSEKEEEEKGEEKEGLSLTQKHQKTPEPNPTEVVGELEEVGRRRGKG